MPLEIIRNVDRADSNRLRRGVPPKNLKPPTVAIAQLDAPDFKTIARQWPDTNRQTIEWLRRLAESRRTPENARREWGVLQAFRVEALNQYPWWRLWVVKLHHETGKPILDPKASDKEGEERFESMFVYPVLPPPPALVEALDELSGKKLSKRIDGGPTPQNPKGESLREQARRLRMMYA